MRRLLQRHERDILREHLYAMLFQQSCQLLLSRCVHVLLWKMLRRDKVSHDAHIIRRRNGRHIRLPR